MSGLANAIGETMARRATSAASVRAATWAKLRALIIGDDAARAGDAIALLDELKVDPVHVRLACEALAKLAGRDERRAAAKNRGEVYAQARAAATAFEEAVTVEVRGLVDESRALLAEVGRGTLTPEAREQRLAELTAKKVELHELAKLKRSDAIALLEPKIAAEALVAADDALAEQHAYLFDPRIVPPWL